MSRPSSDRFAVQTMRLFKGPRARENTITFLERAAKFLRETDDSAGKRVSREDAEKARHAHDCNVQEACKFGKGYCRFYVLTTVGFCEHCGELPAGSAGYIDGGTAWCLGCGKGMVEEGPVATS